MSRKYKSKSLSERVSENMHGAFDDSETTSDEEEIPKVSHLNEDDYDFGNEDSNKTLSEIRKRNVKLLSEQSKKYKGEIVSRKDFDDGTENVCQTSADEDLAMREALIDSDIESSDTEADTEEESDTYHESIDDDNEDFPESELISAKNHANEIGKGICVQNQLSIWEKLLEIRIHSQKILNKANSFPNPVEFNKLCSTNKEFNDTAQELKQNTQTLLETLLDTQATLANQFSEIRNIGLSSRKRSNSESIYEENVSSSSMSTKFAPIIGENFDKFRSYRNAVLLKWEDRTKLLASSSGGTKRKLTDEFDIVKKIDNILIKRDEQISKSQKVKGTYKIFAVKNKYEQSNDKGDEKDNGEEICNPNIYDDTDFYHSQLRELIEFKSNNSSDAYDVTTQFAELQKLRQKMKKKVDTRASKGRKIRYVVHKKLVNFMAPNDTSDWTEESKNELFRSLFVT